MVYVFGMIGFISGFVLGQILLMYWLKRYSREELISNKSLRYTYGVMNWLIAVLCSWSAVEIYYLYFV